MTQPSTRLIVPSNSKHFRLLRTHAAGQAVDRDSLIPVGARAHGGRRCAPRQRPAAADRLHGRGAWHEADRAADFPWPSTTSLKLGVLRHELGQLLAARLASRAPEVEHDALAVLGGNADDCAAVGGQRDAHTDDSLASAQPVPRDPPACCRTPRAPATPRSSAPWPATHRIDRDPMLLRFDRERQCQPVHPRACRGQVRGRRVDVAVEVAIADQVTLPLPSSLP